MNEKQREVLEYIKDFHKQYPNTVWFDCGDINAKYGIHISGASMTALVNYNLLERRENGRSYQYRFLQNKNETEEERNKRDILSIWNGLDGIYAHLANSHASWTRQCEAYGIQFPENLYQQWAKEIMDNVDSRKKEIESNYKEQTGEELFPSAF